MGTTTSILRRSPRGEEELKVNAPPQEQAEDEARQCDIFWTMQYSQNTYLWLHPKDAGPRLVTAAVNAGPRKSNDHFNLSKAERRRERKEEAFESLRTAKASIASFTTATGDFSLWPTDIPGYNLSSSSQKHLAQLSNKQEIKTALRNRNLESASRMRQDYELQQKMSVIQEKVSGWPLLARSYIASAAFQDMLTCPSMHSKSNRPSNSKERHFNGSTQKGR